MLDQYGQYSAFQAYHRTLLKAYPAVLYQEHQQNASQSLIMLGSLSFPQQYFPRDGPCLASSKVNHLQVSMSSTLFLEVSFSHFHCTCFQNQSRPLPLIQCHLNQSQ